jgi:hypothetical protein
MAIAKVTLHPINEEPVRAELLSLGEACTDFL